MNYRKFGQQDWQVSEIGYGMWGMAGWSGSDEEESFRSLDQAVELGCNFFDTAWAYGDGLSEQILGKLIKRFPNKKLYTASKIPPKNLQWPPIKGSVVSDVFPKEHIITYVEDSLKNLQLETMDLMQFHVWEDQWNESDDWKEAVEKLKKEGKVQAFGISVNRWEPNNVLDTLKSGCIDSVQVIYNIFDQSPDDELLPLCQEKKIAVIARVPFDEGTLTGTLTKESTWPEGDWRNTYFVPENLNSSVDHADALKPLAAGEGISMPEMALRFILSNPSISTMIPGMRKLHHVNSNLSNSDKGKLPEELIAKLKKHRWDRVPTEWSQ